MSDRAIEILWVVAGAVLTAVIAGAVAYWMVREGRDSTPGGSDQAS